MLFASVPEVTQRHAILLTDGENRERPGELAKAIRTATGVFQCDCRGAGTDWRVEEIRQIATALLGTVDIIPEPAQMQEQFRALMQASMARGVNDAQLRMWTPQGAQVLFVRQVSPTVEDLTARRTTVNPLTGGYPTGAWADESRDYHVAIRLPAKAIGQEQLAARVQIALGDDVAAQGLVKATWSNNSELTARIDKQVAHYTGQTELAQMIQEGLAAKASGDDATATTKLGRAVQLAAETGNDEATSKLRKVVDIEDEKEGTVRLKVGGQQGRRDGARHRVDQDHPDQEVRCPAGHESTATDYCDVCGVAMDPDATSLHPRWTPRPTTAGACPRTPLPELPDRQRAGRAVLRELRLRLHDRFAAAPGRAGAGAGDRRPPA